MSLDTLHAFYRAFRGDRSFIQLFATEDTGLFPAAVVAMGKENGFQFEEGDVLAAMKDPNFFLNEALGGEELSDAELAVMAGGMTLTELAPQVGSIKLAAIGALSNPDSSSPLPSSNSTSNSTSSTGSSSGGTSSKG